MRGEAARKTFSPMADRWTRNEDDNATYIYVQHAYMRPSVRAPDRIVPSRSGRDRPFAAHA
eukprot:9178745-Pyramimonas_sp.AAC.1